MPQLTPEQRDALVSQMAEALVRFERKRGHSWLDKSTSLAGGLLVLLEARDAFLSTIPNDPSPTPAPPAPPTELSARGYTDVAPDQAGTGALDWRTLARRAANLACYGDAEAYDGLDVAPILDAFAAVASEADRKAREECATICEMEALSMGQYGNVAYARDAIRATIKEPKP